MGPIGIAATEGGNGIGPIGMAAGGSGMGPIGIAAVALEGGSGIGPIGIADAVQADTRRSAMKATFRRSNVLVRIKGTLSWRQISRHKTCANLE
jgi:hypothetical protein